MNPVPLIRAEVFEYDQATSQGVFLVRLGDRALGLVRYRPFGDPFTRTQSDRLIELYEVQVRAA